MTGVARSLLGVFNSAVPVDEEEERKVAVERREKNKNVVTTRELAMLAKHKNPDRAIQLMDKSIKRLQEKEPTLDP